LIKGGEKGKIGSRAWKKAFAFVLEGERGKASGADLVRRSFEVTFPYEEEGGKKGGEDQVTHPTGKRPPPVQQETATEGR